MTPSTSRSTSSPLDHVQSTSTAGGTLGVVCTGERIALGFATPGFGWKYQKTVSSTAIEVHFNEENGPGEIEIHATCSNGLAHFEVDDHHSSTSRSSDR